MRKPKKVWAEQAIVIKKTHPFVRSKQEAAGIAVRHTKHGFDEIQETKGSFRVGYRPKTCFRTFRSQKRGNHVTVIWGELKKGAQRSRSCR